MPLLALFTGARLNELVQLYLDDIKQEGDIWYIDINKDGDKQLKTYSSKRKVPLHPFLIELGFIDRLAYVPDALRKMNKRHLFDRATLSKSGKIGNIVTQYFTRHRRKCGVGGMEGEKSTVNFHSFRHTFITEAYNLPQYNEQAIKELVGHEDDKKNITATVYKNAYSMASLYDEVVSRLDFYKRLGLHVLKDHARRWMKIA